MLGVVAGGSPSMAMAVMGITPVGVGMPEGLIGSDVLQVLGFMAMAISSVLPCWL
jgi:hypothetical protein